MRRISVMLIFFLLLSVLGWSGGKGSTGTLVADNSLQKGSDELASAFPGPTSAFPGPTSAFPGPTSRFPGPV